jgi:hypothetical protein
MAHGESGGCETVMGQQERQKVSVKFLVSYQNTGSGHFTTLNYITASEIGVLHKPSHSISLLTS